MSMPNNPYISACEKCLPVFTHYLTTKAARFDLTPDNRNVVGLSTMLAIAFSLSYENSLKLTSKESEESTDKRLLKTRSVCSYFVVAWAFREAGIYIEKQK
jgi:hypothetical protein